MTEAQIRRLKWLVCVLLGTAALAVYSQALHFGFVNFDDPDYVYENWHVQRGLNWQSVRWAFTTDAAANWHPVTWLSHILDCQLYGLQPVGHHLTSLLLHAANSVLLFLLLNRLTGALWRSALVAAMFALHPLRVESVVWIAERKDVLSAFFFFCAIGAYVRYVDKWRVASGQWKVFYGLSLLFFALGLMSKPMLVTLPFVLLLLDYWPLKRLAVAEKIPFFALAAGSSLVTYMVQNRLGVVASLALFPFGVRVANVPVAYARYVTNTFLPSHLAAVYPYVGWRPGEIIGAVALLAAVTALALWRARRSPWLAVGWFWFLGMLVPTIGLVQVGAQSMADRYSYLPGIGLGIMAVWGLHELSSGRPRLRGAIALLAALVAVVFALLAWRQTAVYKDSGTLWEAALRSYPECLPARNNLSRWLMDQGQWDQALDQSRKVLTFRPADTTAHNDLSRIYLHQGRVDEAIAEALKSIQAQARSQVNRQTLALAYLKKADYAAAEASLREAIRIDPSAPDVWCNLGFTLLQQGRVSDAASAYRRSLELNPDGALAHNDLGNILLSQKRMDEAFEHFQRAVELSPSFAEAHYNLAGVLFAAGQLDEALSQYEKVTHLSPQLPGAHYMLGKLAAAYAKSGRPDRAITITTRALDLARAANETTLADNLTAQLRSLREGK